jgi:hypothetical protein
MTVSTQPIKRGARRTYALLLNEGGWWSMRELGHKLGLTWHNSLGAQLFALHIAGHIARKGTGVSGDPYTYGVTAKCTPLSGIELDTSSSVNKGVNT